MLSDESSSDSETGRFKSGSTKKEDTSKRPNSRGDLLGRRFTDRGKNIESDRLNREFERDRDRDRHRSERAHRDSNKDRNRERHESSRDKFRSSRRSPVRNRSRERRHSRSRHSRDRPSTKESSWQSRKQKSRSKDRKSPERKREYSEKKDTSTKIKQVGSRSRENSFSSPEVRGKRSIVKKPEVTTVPKQLSPVADLDNIESDEDVQPGSYYSMLPAVIKDKPEKQKEKHNEKSIVKEKLTEPQTSSKIPEDEDIKSEVSSEIDSSDDERLRAKLLNLERELKRTRKKKHKKKHRRRDLKSGNNKDPVDDDVTIVEVSSTTDIQEKTNEEINASANIKTHKESTEEGELSSDENSKQSVEIDETDLRHRLKRSSKKSDKAPDQSKTVDDVFGPALPPHLQKRFKKSSEKEGPALPSTDKNIGPSIPSNMRKVLAEADPVEIKDESSEEDDAIGPVPVDSNKITVAHKKLEERALDIKIKKMEGNSVQSSEVTAREEWMLELPAAKAKIIGIEARTFRAKQGPDMSDRSSWTDTPEQKARKAAGVVEAEDPEAALQRDARSRIIAKRDEEQEASVKKHKKKHKRDESLLDMHQKKLKKKKKKEEKEDGKPERRPFSRDVDLQVNKFDEAQKRSIIKKAQQLDSRFSRGEAKYL